MNGQTIRNAGPDDFDAIAALTNHFIINTTIHFGTEPVTADALRSSWRSEREIYPWLVAEIAPAKASEQPSFAGFAKAGVWRSRPAYSWTPETGIYVARQFHRRGVGRSLYQALIVALRERGFHSAVAGITLPNDASVALHESVGFLKVGHVVQAGWKFNQWHDIGFWQVMLRPPTDVAGPLGHAEPPDAGG